MTDLEEKPFYGTAIIRRREEEKVREILSQFDKEPFSDELKKRIWEELQAAKQRGDILSPFKVVARRDSSHAYPEYVEVILDTKV